MSEITAFILSGGKSSRLRTNKSFLEINEKKIIEIIFEKLAGIFNNICLSTNQPELYAFLPIPKIPDVIKEMGPLGGIHACLRASETERNFIVSCDMPLITRKLITHIIEYETEKKILLPSNNGKIEFMCGVYGKSTLPFIENLMESQSDSVGKSKKLSIWNYVHNMNFEAFEASQLPFYTKELFFNLNTHEDYEKIKSLVRANKALIENG